MRRDHRRVRNFVEWTLQQPWLVLHELAHGYHHRFITHRYKIPRSSPPSAGRRDPCETIPCSLQPGVRKGLRPRRCRRVFAESTEAFFGTNDFYPFVRPELKEHDKGMFAAP